MTMTSSHATSFVTTAIATSLIILSFLETRLHAIEEATAFFENKIRPVFESTCIECHSGTDPKGGVSLDSAEGWQAAGVIQPHDSAKSVLYLAMSSVDPTKRMPPPDHSDQVGQDVLSDFRKWIDDGASDPRENSSLAIDSKAPRLRRNRVFTITNKDLSHWAYQPLQTFKFDTAADTSIQTPSIDSILQTSYDEIGITANPSASPRELVRRAYFDLWGLPPTYEQVKKFEDNPSDQAWQELIDGLLESHHYGERWGRYWLDLVRYAESNGYERDGPKPNAWRYRDYVIDAFNRDLPYSDFIIEQLAGDLVYASSRASHDSLSGRRDTVLQSDNKIPNEAGANGAMDEASRAMIVATGFYRLHRWDDEPDDSQAAEHEDVDDIVSTTGTAFLGMTIGCARCHDHKFDPLSQRDYYSLTSFLSDIEPYGLLKQGGGGRGTGKIQRYLVDQQSSQRWEEDRNKRSRDVKQLLDQATDPAARLTLEDDLRRIGDEAAPFDAALAINSIPGGPRATFILHRGDYQSRRDEVQPALPEILRRCAADDQKAAEEADPNLLSSPNFLSSRRLEFAKWVAADSNPLTARVFVNRVWQHHFGTGIVSTQDDFGITGRPPTNSQLLDYLAGSFIDHKYSIKTLHRTLMNSQAYRRASTTTSPSQKSDPNNETIWRQSIRRLDAEAIRDTVLSTSNQLNDKRHGPSVFPTLSAEIRQTTNPITILNWVDSAQQEQFCRSVYLVVKRSLRIPILEAFDVNDSTSSTGRRPSTTTAPQALMLLNDQFIHDAASTMLLRTGSQPGLSIHQRLDALWKIAYQRLPKPAEIETCKDFFQVSSDEMDEDSWRVDQHKWESLCRGLLNSNEFIFVD